MSRTITMVVGLFMAVEPVLGISPELTAEQRAWWQKGFMLVRNNFAEVDGQFYCCALYDVRYDNSRHAVVSGWLAERTEQLAFDSPLLSWVKSQTLRPPQEEAVAYCRMLPSFEPGMYGYILHAQVTAVGQDGSIEISQVKLVDSQALQHQRESDRKALDQWSANVRTQARHRLWEQRHHRAPAAMWGQARQAWEEWIGSAEKINRQRYTQRQWLEEQQKQFSDQSLIVLAVNDRRLQPGKPFDNQQLVMVRTPAGQTVALPGVLFRRGLTQSQFEKLLAAKNMTSGQFADLVELQLRNRPDNPQAAVLELLGQSVPPLPQDPATVQADQPADPGQADRHRPPGRFPFAVPRPPRPARPPAK